MVDEPQTPPVTPDPPSTPPSSPPAVPEVEPVIEPTVRMVTEEVPEKETKETDPEEVDPDDEKTISKLVSKQLDPVTRRIEQQSNLIETSNFISANPEYAKYRETIVKHMNHPAYKNIPVDRIAKMVAGDDLIKIGAAKEREAAAKAAATRTPGSAPRFTPTGKDWHTASKDDYKAQRAAIFGHG